MDVDAVITRVDPEMTPAAVWRGPNGASFTQSTGAGDLRACSGSATRSVFTGGGRSAEHRQRIALAALLVLGRGDANS